MPTPIPYWSFFVIGIEVVGIATAMHAIMHVRSDRGTIAWCVALVAMPLIALPLYAVFGRAKFARYRETISEAFDDVRNSAKPLAASVKPFEVKVEEPIAGGASVLAKLSPFCFTFGNEMRLLINGKATFDAIFQSIREARDYILIEFYIIRDDQLGLKLRDELVACAKRGIRVYVLYDEIGSKNLSAEYLDSLREVGVATASFGPPLRRCDFFHINFRNHRKIVVVDGERAFVGGHNVGDEYLGNDPKVGAWRDTHVSLRGPAVLDCQRIFLESWYWATRESLALQEICRLPDTAIPCEALVLPTGPIRGADVCTLAYAAIINAAHKRCWIASPYFVPSDSILDMLRSAALRGVDVRILLPERPDHWLVHLASIAYLETLEEWNIRVYRYGMGFLHQKVILVDDSLAGITTINLDQRSFHLNFEIGVFTRGQAFIREVSEMLELDFANSRLTTASFYRNRRLPFRLAVQIARLFSPVL